MTLGVGRAGAGLGGAPSAAAAAAPHQRRREAAGVAAGGDAAGVGARRPHAGRGLALRRHAQPAEGRRDRSAHRHHDRPVALVAHVGPGGLRGRHHLGHRALAHRRTERRRLDPIERARRPPPRRPLHHVALRPRAGRVPDAVQVGHRRVPRVELREADDRAPPRAGGAGMLRP